MRFKRGEFALSELRKDIVRYRFLTMILLAIIALLALALAQNREKTIILPPERSKYVLEEFPEAYIEGFALSWAKILFDYTPSDCTERNHQIARHLASSELLNKLSTENNFIEKEKLTQKFYPKKLDIKKDKVVFKGTLLRHFENNSMSKDVIITMGLAQGSLGQPLLRSWSIGEIK